MQTLKLRLARQTLIVPVGVPGSGKSTLLATAEGLFRYGADDVRKTVFGDVSIQGHGARVHSAARAILEVALSSGLPCAYDATNTTPSARRVLTTMAREHRYTTVALVSQVPVDWAKRRNSAREEGLVPGHVIDRMANQVQHVIPTIFKEDFDDVHTFDENVKRIEIEWI